MFGLAARLISGVFTPLIDQFSASSARLLRKLALFVVAAVAMVVVLIALTIAFGLWIASIAGAIIGVLAVAGVYFLIAAGALFFALRPFGSKSKQARADQEKAKAAVSADAGIDAFAAPLLGILQNLGLRREQFAVLAGTSLAKQLGPVPLVGLAIVAGFLIGRMWDGWRGLLSTDLLASILGSGLFNRDKAEAEQEDA